MHILTRLSLISIFLLSVITPGMSTAEEAALHISSSTPDIVIAARSNDRVAIKLPKLQYVFHIEAKCAAGQAPQSILLSIADTRKRVSADSMRARTEVTITVPSGQIAPLTIAQFCLSTASLEQPQKDPVTVRGALSAQAALLCSDGNDEQMIYTSLPLDVTLHCMDKELRATE